MTGDARAILARVHHHERVRFSGHGTSPRQVQGLGRGGRRPAKGAPTFFAIRANSERLNRGHRCRDVGLRFLTRRRATGCSYRGMVANQPHTFAIENFGAAQHFKVMPGKAMARSGRSPLGKGRGGDTLLPCHLISDISDARCQRCQAKSGNWLLNGRENHSYWAKTAQKYRSRWRSSAFET